MERLAEIVERYGLNELEESLLKKFIKLDNDIWLIKVQRAKKASGYIVRLKDYWALFWLSNKRELSLAECDRNWEAERTENFRKAWNEVKAILDSSLTE